MRPKVLLPVLFFGVAELVCAQPARPQRTANPHGPINMACESCHTSVSWKPIRAKPEFNHNTETKYPLRGLHENVACSRCHISKVFSEVGKQCADCHADIHRRQFGAACQDCHTVRGWRVSLEAVKNHLNRFPLFGAHAAVPCDSCHRGAATGVFIGLSTECVSCHLSDYQKSQNPNHVAAKFSRQCETCHGADRWQGAKFDHAALTNFALVGAHASLTCVACHMAGRFAGTPTDCFGCHVTDFNATQNPSHVAAGFPHNCAACHTAVSWQGATFNHNTTRFALTGGHANVQCSACHVNGRFAGTPMDCAGCHMPDFHKTTNPPHGQGNIPTKCDTCHTTTNWQGAKFDHNLSQFKLTGSHAGVPCASCHASGQYWGVPMDCSGCHMKDYNKTTKPNHAAAGKPTMCEMCHTTAQWQQITFSHNKTTFPLTGSHINLPCTQCHVGSNFAAAPAQCSGCHLKDFQKTTTPNHAAAGFPTACEACHTTVQWKGATFDHNKTPFPLTGAHKTVLCAQCHANNKFSGTPVGCGSCHMTDFKKTSNPNHAAAGFPTDCSVCHTTASWAGAVFDHSKTPFALTGAHTTVQCSQCHVNGKFAGTPMDCGSCHMKDFNGTKNPNHAAAGFPTDCSLCHTTASWAGAVFDHNKTPFALTGAHTTVQCALCHVNGKFAGTPMDCGSCHMTDFKKATNPNHAAAGFPTDCSLCHSTASWAGAVFDHSKTPFPLTGAHTTVQCAQCHVKGNFTSLPSDCGSCHMADFKKTTNPNHAAAGFPTDCSLCHSTASWAGAVFDHSKTPFALTGAHTTVQCAQCHVNGKFAGTPMDCGSCHLADFKKTTNPNHAAAGFPTDCSLCHSTASWAGAVFDHSKTPFALTGAHTTVQCAQCHVNGKFAGTPMDCGSCHLADFKKTNNPNHAAAGFPTDCSLCHTTASWAGAVFDHNKTPFPLTGAHTNVQCAQCHPNGKFAGLPTDCNSCHAVDYKKTNNPPHAAAGFPTDCSLCHTTTSWAGATFNHNNTPFPLTGAHTTVQCASCHVNNNFTGLPTDCGSCHLADYKKTNNPPHAAAGFPTDCSLCHTTASWAGATFNHNNTPFPLTGAHTTVQCASCHVGGSFTSLPTDCNSCHAADYKKTNNPPHASAGFPTDCSLCHTTASWAGATFNHNNTPFPLTGAHTTVQCASCHVNNNFTGLPTDCYSCHKTQYQSTTNPNHAAAGFPQDCSMCHTTASWGGATFDHSSTGFPLTGAHATLQCAQCHAGGKFSGLSASCYSCHQAQYQSTTNPNHAAAGFPQDCSVCHSTTSWAGAVFNHNNTPFPLTGAHTSVACSSCHVGNKFAGTPTDCYSCHKAVYTSTTNPNHVAAGFPTTCDTCHTTTSWSGATFNHTWFQLPHGNNATCGACHTNSANYSVFVCTNCHTQAQTDPHHTDVKGYVYNSLNCYQCHQGGGGG